MADFGRIVAVDIGQPGQRPRRLLARWDTPSLHISATVRRTADGTDDTAEVTVRGLAPQTVAVLQERGVMCRVLAGYGDTLSTIAAGRVLPTTLRGPRRESGADWITSWSISDGGLDLRDVVVSESWAGEVSAAEVLDVLIRRSGLARGSISLGSEHRWSSGYVVRGTVREALRKIAAVTGSVIVVQDGAVQAWPVGQPRVTTGIRLASGTGLIGSPEPSDDGVWTVRADLLSGTMPGDALVIDSETLSGQVEVLALDHEIDSTDGPYQTTLEVRA
jgi:hypothetical protein